MNGPTGWRNGLAVALGGFILLVAEMVGIAVSQRVDLVVDDYYEQSLLHDQTMRSAENTRRLGSAFSLIARDDEILIRFPPAMDPDQIKGRCLLYRPSDRSQDRAVRLAPDSAGHQRIATEPMLRGLWTAKLLWQYRGEAYSFETPVILQ